MNTQTIHGLAKTLRALSVLFISLSVVIIAAPLSAVVGTHTVAGVHNGDMGWPATIRYAVMFVLIGAVLFCCYLFSRREKRGLLATVVLWSAAIVAGGFAAMLIFRLVFSLVSHYAA
jgi:hypothetical protein